MKRERLVRAILRGIRNFICFFAFVAFIITCCTVLFLKTLADETDITFTADNLGNAAKITFLNVILLSLLFTLIDLVRRILTVERPIKQITKAAEQMIRGDFSIRIKQKGLLGTDSAFHRIIECFNKMADELGSVETLRTDFIANVSHEMKTPLAVMQNYGALLQSPSLSEEDRIAYAEGVTDASRRMADMMTNILKLNYLENRQIYPQMVDFDLGEQLCACILQYESVWESKQIALETELAEEVIVRADAELLGHVWNNLLSNAFKFTPEGGTVKIALTATDEIATVTVSDTGCGMTPEVGAHIFEKFYQGDRSHSVQGNGLGLALVKRVIDILHGEISVESAPGSGSAFTVRIPRR